MRECATTSHLLSLNKASHTGTGLHPMVVVQRSTMEIYKTIHAVAQIISCSPQIDPKFLLLKTKPTQFIDHEEFELVSIQSLHPYVLECLLQDYTLHTIKRNVNTHQTTNPLIYNVVLPGRYARWNKTYGSNNQ